MSTDKAQLRTFPCQHCERSFKRLEHVQRHERTHTKSTPYKCSCGRGFPRGDLLRRHEKSAHNTENGRRRRSYGSNQSCDPIQSHSSIRSPRGLGHESRQARVDSNSSQILHNNLYSSPTTATGPTQLGSIADEGIPFEQRSLEPGATVRTGLNQGHQTELPADPNTFDFNSVPFGNGLDPFDLFGEADTILENVDFSSLFLPYDFGLDQGIQGDNADPSYNKLTDHNEAPPQQASTLLPNSGSQDPNSLSRFGSPLPSVRPRDDKTSAPNLVVDDTTKSSPCWKISKLEYRDIQLKISNISDYLPTGFVLPSRHSMSRYLEGCIKGLYDSHMPNLHIASWSAVSAAPDLLLSMAAIGAQFRFEGNVASSLFCAAKSATMHQLQIYRDSRAVDVLSYPPSLTDGSTLASSKSVRGVPQNGVLDLDEQSASARYERLQTMQAILCLMVQASWGPRQLVSEAIVFQSLLAELVREDGLGPELDGDVESSTTSSDQAKWLRWIRAESLRRTKLMAYSFVNLQNVAFNVPPCILTSEIHLSSPASQSEWNARTPDSWIHARQTSKLSRSTFAEAFRSLFQNYDSASNARPVPSSSIENYALIFAILQRIFLLREGGTTSPTGQSNGTLGSDNLESLSRALQNWQSRWEASPESNIEPQSSSGPVAFNSTALLRLAWIRLHSDLGPCRNLATMDPALVVEAFQKSPPLTRHSELMPALLHAAHALSVPVRLGINYVAKTQTLSWSVQHSLCNLECAIFLSKWFEAVASTVATAPLTSQEVGLISVIRGIVLETGFFREDAFEPATDEQGWQRLIRHLGTAVATLWGHIFSGTHVFDLVSTIGTSLNMYAKLLEDAHTPINGQL